VVRNVNDKNAQLQKQLENVVREGDQFMCMIVSASCDPFLLANGEINLLSNKTAGVCSHLLTVAHLPMVSELERDLELERRKVRDLQDSSRERDKEYQKLKVGL
jgi:hypothetical protein